MQLMQDAGHRGAIRESSRLCPRNGQALRRRLTHALTQFGVTDGFNRLHEIPNVLVVDASCFTTGAEKNPR